jgi:hypothetical protein
MRSGLACGGKNVVRGRLLHASTFLSHACSLHFFFFSFRHFALTILPGIINGGTYERIQTLLLFTTGAAASFYVAKLGNPETAFDEGPSLWCIVAIPQHLVTWLVVLKYRESNPPGGKYKPAGIDLVSVDDYRTTTAPVKLRRRQRL